MKNTRAKIILPGWLTLRKIWALWFLFLAGPLWPGQTETGNPLDYYRLHFEEKKKHPLADSLFEKTVWHKKVSHLVVEEYGEKYRLTLLMIIEYPHNYKSQNYALYYEFADYRQAFDKMMWMNNFLKKNGVMRIKILGSKITSEKILYPAES